MAFRLWRFYRIFKQGIVNELLNIFITTGNYLSTFGFLYFGGLFDFQSFIIFRRRSEIIKIITPLRLPFTIMNENDIETIKNSN